MRTNFAQARATSTARAEANAPKREVYVRYDAQGRETGKLAYELVGGELYRVYTSTPARKYDRHLFTTQANAWAYVTDFMNHKI